MQVIERFECLSPDFLKKMQTNTKTKFRWDRNYTSDMIEVTSDNRCLFLKEDTYQFRSVIAQTGFEKGMHYWELVADARTDNEMKIGVTKSRDFDLKTAFSDY